jgi:glycosyltransferase involved in cell wall biosynthesis
MTPLLSIAIPAYNEAANIPELRRRLSDVCNLLSIKTEIVICENGSSDDTHKELLKWQANDDRVRIVQLSRNFHMEGGMMAALSHVSGDACVIMSADLQDPPELITEMVSLWQSGFEHVYTVIKRRHGESRFRRIAAEIFYSLINRVSDTPVPRNASDFRLVDRQMYQVFNALPEKFRMVRSVWGWIGFRSTSIEYERAPRTAGKSSFNPFVTAGFAVRGLLASSLTPLKLIPIVGLVLSVISFVSLFLGIARALVEGVPFPGFGTITSLILALFGLLFLLLSVLAEYIGLIYVETRARPAFVERQARADNLT